MEKNYKKHDKAKQIRKKQSLFHSFLKTRNSTSSWPQMWKRECLGRSWGHLGAGLGDPWGQKPLLSLRFKGNLGNLRKTRYRKKHFFGKTALNLGPIWGAQLATVVGISLQKRQPNKNQKKEKQENRKNKNTRK